MKGKSTKEARYKLAVQLNQHLLSFGKLCSQLHQALQLPPIKSIKFNNNLKTEFIDISLWDSPYIVKCNGMYLIVPDIQHSKRSAPNKLVDFTI